MTPKRRDVTDNNPIIIMRYFEGSIPILTRTNTKRHEPIIVHVAVSLDMIFNFLFGFF